jgi:site-specific DNA recombinase
VIDVYARISYAPSGELVKVDDQVELCVDEVHERGGQVGEVFKEPSLSAWAKSVVRPKWELAMGRIESGASDGVIFYDVSRFTRKVMEGERLVEVAGGGAKVWSLFGEYDLTTADGRRHFREAVVAAAAESDKISERVKRGKVRRAKKGKVQSPSRSFAMPGFLPKPAGWEPGDPRERVPDEVVEAERELVRECYRRLLAGEHLAALVRELNARGLRSARGRQWQRRDLARVVRRAAVAGLVELNGEIVGKLAGVEPVVSREEWERLCAVFDGRRRGRPPGRVHLLSGILYCGRCGMRMSGVPRRMVTPYPDGSKRREYRCRSMADSGGCGRNFIDALLAETAVAEAVKTRLGDPRRAERIAARLAVAREDRARIEREIHMLNERADFLAEKTAEWGPERVDKGMAPILKRLGKLRSELAALEEPETAQVAAQDATAEWDKAQAAGDFDTMRAMVKRAFPRLTLIPPARRMDHRVERFDWDGATLPNATVAGPDRPASRSTRSRRAAPVAGQAGRRQGGIPGREQDTPHRRAVSDR